MANTVLNSAILSKEYLRQYQNNLVLAGLVNYSKASEFGSGEKAKGASIRIKREIISGIRKNDLSWQNGVAAGVADTLQTSVALVIDSELSAFMAMNDTDLALKIEDYSANFIKPRAKRLATEYDLCISNAIVNASVGLSAIAGLDQFGNAGSANIPGYAAYTYGTFGGGLTPDNILAAKQGMLEIGADESDGLHGVLSPYAQRTLLQANSNIFNTYVEDGAEYKKGRIGGFAGIDWVTTQNLATHTNGSLSAVTPAVSPTSGELATGWSEFTSITVPSIAANAIPNAGDVFTVPGVYQVNRITKQVTSVPFQVTVLATPVAGDTTLLTSPIITGGNYQNASATCMGKTWTLLGAVGAYGQESLILTEDAIYGANIALSVPSGGFIEAAQMKSDDVAGIKMRLLRTYDMYGISGVDGTNPGECGRIDMRFGIKIVNPEKIVRIRS